MEIKKDFRSSGLLAHRKTIEQAKAENANRWNEDSKVALKSHATKKLNTTMIGGLSKFEAAFGELWGHGKPEDALDEDERYFRERWIAVRNEILNQGNNQKRALLAEIDQYSVRFNKYEYNFIIKDQEENGRE